VLNARFRSGTFRADMRARIRERKACRALWLFPAIHLDGGFMRAYVATTCHRDITGRRRCMDLHNRGGTYPYRITDKRINFRQCGLHSARLFKVRMHDASFIPRDSGAPYETYYLTSRDQESLLFFYILFSRESSNSK